MPTVRKLSEQEVAAITAKKEVRKRINPFINFFDEVVSGEAVAVELEEGDKLITVRNQLNAAAKAKGFTLKFIRRNKSTRNEVRAVVE